MGIDFLSWDLMLHLGSCSGRFYINAGLVFENGCVVRPLPLKEGKPNAVIVSDVYNVPKVTGSPRALVLFP